MMPSVKLIDLGVVDYGDALARQRELFDGVIARRGVDAGDAGWLVFCEHPHVYTIGKSGRVENLLISENLLRERGAGLYRVERGGDITYHGPGQIMGYPILDLEKVGMGLREYIDTLEKSVIETMAHFGIEAGRIEGKTGVWLADEGGDERAERKICAIGVQSSHYVTMHGFALNVATDLGWFEMINPCGRIGGKVTSMNAETGWRVRTDEVKGVLCGRLAENLGVVVD